MSEILAPAGSKSNAYAAINAGADAVYLGLKEFSARSSAENFDFEAFKEIVSYAHAFGVKVYVAMNTLVKDSELVNFLQTAIKAWNCGADALIISDLFLGKYLKSKFPQMVLHLSTQAGVCNAYAAELAKEYGFERVILARETDIEDIKQIARIIETEVFIQGALCTCFSGQCYMSSFAGGNSGNRGKCKQPCRKKYSINREGFTDGAYRLSLADLCVGDDIKKLIEAGVFSFKIEGRMRRAEYVSAAVKYYKNLLFGNSADNDLSDLKRTYNRGNYTRGLAFGQDKSFISSSVQGHIGEFAGAIKVENGKFICQSTFKFSKGDSFKILRGGKEVGGASYVGDCKFGFILSSKLRLKNGDKAFITTDASLNSKLSEIKKQITLNISARFNAGEKYCVTVNGIEFCGDKPLERATGSPLTENDIKICFSKTDKFPYKVIFQEITTQNAFVLKSDLNAVRRKIFESYFYKVSQNNNKTIEDDCEIPQIINQVNNKSAVICTDLNGISTDIAIYKPTDYFGEYECKAATFSGEKYLYLPPFLKGAELEKLKPVIKKFDGVYCDGIYAFKLCESLNIPLFAGTGLNISNRLGVLECGAKYFVVSKEISYSESQILKTSNAFYFNCGNLKIMDLLYCPFGKHCQTCDKRGIYELTDENSRKFPLRRYKISECRFEVYNCANLVCENYGFGSLKECSLEKDCKKFLKASENTEKLKEYFCGNYTRGHSELPVK